MTLRIPQLKFDKVVATPNKGDCQKDRGYVFQSAIPPRGTVLTELRLCILLAVFLNNLLDLVRFIFLRRIGISCGGGLFSSNI